MCIKPIGSTKLKFNQSSIFAHNGFNNLFQTVQETRASARRGTNTRGRRHFFKYKTI